MRGYVLVDDRREPHRIKFELPDMNTLATPGLPVTFHGVEIGRGITTPEIGIVEVVLNDTPEAEMIKAFSQRHAYADFSISVTPKKED